MFKNFCSGEWRKRAVVGLSIFALFSNSVAAFGDNSGRGDAEKMQTETPIKHVIVIIGENRTFDHVLLRTCRRAEVPSRIFCRKES